MRDEERIGLYYDFGTLDWRSEMDLEKKGLKKSWGYSATRYLKLAALLWSLVLKNLSAGNRK